MIKKLYIIIFITLVAVSLGFCASVYLEKNKPQENQVKLEIPKNLPNIDTIIENWIECKKLSDIDAVIENCIESKKLDSLEKQTKKGF